MQQTNRVLYQQTAINVIIGAVLGYFLSKYGMTDSESQIFLLIFGGVLAAWNVFTSKQITSAIPSFALVVVAVIVANSFKFS